MELRDWHREERGSGGTADGEEFGRTRVSLGEAFPPPKGTGNYNGEEQKFKESIVGYKDAFE